jgi:4-amino-4-deoxy-L-arabinose transferase-like glycosyltransferase
MEKYAKKLLQILIPLIFLAVTFLYFPFRARFEFDPDEGINVMKALMVARGYPLYSQIWSDQPPFLTYLLAIPIDIFGNDINVARTLVLLLSTLLFGACFSLLMSTWGVWHALTGAILVFLLPFYTSLSVSVMVGLPAIAFAVISLLTLVNWHRQRNSLWLILSAIALSLSVLTKLFAAFLAPIFILGLLLDEFTNPRQTSTLMRLRPAVLWSVIFAAILLTAALVLIGPANLDQLISSHLSARLTEYYDTNEKIPPIISYLRESWATLLLAGLALPFIFRTRRYHSLYLVAWAVAAFFLFMFHRPVWYHHQLLVTIPAALLAAIPVGEAITHIPSLLRTSKRFNASTLLSIAALSIFTITLITRVPMIFPEFIHPPLVSFPTEYTGWPERNFLVKMIDHAPNTEWIITNLPMYAFRVGLPIPPHLAAITEKRLDTGDLTESEILAAVKSYNPAQVLIGRRIFPQLKAYLDKNYRLSYSRGKRYLYIRKDS